MNVDRLQWTPEFSGDFMTALVIAAIAGRSSLKAWVEVWRALQVQKVQHELLQRSGLGDDLGLVDGQRSDTVEMRTLAGQTVTVLAVNALQLGCTIDVGTHVMYRDADLSKFLELHPKRQAQVTRLRLNTREMASDLVISMCEQGNHAKTLTVEFPSPKVAALLQAQPTRAQVQLAAKAAPGTVLVVGSGSDNFGLLSGIVRNRENLAVWLARAGAANAAQQPLCSWRALLEDPPLPITTTTDTCPTLAVLLMSGGDDPAPHPDLVREVDGFALALSSRNQTGYLCVQRDVLQSGQTRYTWVIHRKGWCLGDASSKNVAIGHCQYLTAVEAALGRAKAVAKIATGDIY